jgi:hypothetical protein
MNVYLSAEDLLLVAFRDRAEADENEAAIAELRTAMPNNKVVVLTGSVFLTQISPPFEKDEYSQSDTFPLAGHPQLDLELSE